MTNLLLKNGADPNAKAKNGLAPMHLCAQEDRVNVAAILASNGAELDSETKAGYTPLHVACHFGSLSMVRFLLLDHQVFLFSKKNHGAHGNNNSLIELFIHFFLISD